MPGLLDLPAELRLHIYGLAVTEPWPVSIMQHVGIGKPPRLQTALALMRVDRQLTHDIMPLYWSCNTFTLYLSGLTHDAAADRMVHLWLHTMVKQAASSLNSLEFVLSTPCRATRQSQSLATPRRPVGSCAIIIMVRLDARAEWRVQVYAHDICTYIPGITFRFQEVLDQVSEKRLVTKDHIWSIYDTCYNWRHPGQKPRSYSDYVAQYNQQTDGDFGQ